MVWFYPASLTSEDVPEIAFQSHYGLILSEDKLTPVLLILGLSIPLWSDFIKRWQEIVDTADKTFNPTMVWFYHKVLVEIEYHEEFFQSHYGLILSLWKMTTYRGSSSLSIPLWSDFIFWCEQGSRRTL